MLQRAARDIVGLGALACALCPAVASADGSISFQGYSGLLNIPTAEVTPEGTLEPVFTNQLDRRFQGEQTRPRNTLFSLGLFPNLEIGGRIADTSEMFDLSGNVKLRLPTPRWAPRLAVGWQDFVGEAKTFEARYAVASGELGPVQLSLGYGLGPERLDGVFAGAKLRVTDSLAVMGEHDARDAFVGARWVSPPYRRVRATVMGQTPVAAPRRFELAVGLELPLTRRLRAPETPLKRVKGRADRFGRSPLPRWDPPSPTPRESVGYFDEKRLWELNWVLGAVGLADVRVGHVGQIIVIEYENQRYRASELDVLGVVLGAVAAYATEPLTMFFVVAKREGLPVLEVRGHVEAYREFLLGNHADPQLEVRSPHRGYDHGDTMWVAEQGERPVFISRHRRYYLPPVPLARMELYPVSSPITATEDGGLGVAVALGGDVVAPLWRGGAVHSTLQLPLVDTHDGGEGRATATLASRVGLRDAQIHHAARLAPSVLSMASAGVFRFDYTGILSDTIWSPGRGAHSLRARLGYFAPVLGGERHRDLWLGTYRYDHAPLDTALSVTSGKFWYQDRGISAELTRRFDDASVGMFYKFNGDHAAGVRISLPLTQRKRQERGRRVQIRGPSEISASLQTSMGAGDGADRVIPGIATIPNPRYDLTRAYLDDDRLSPAYVTRNLPRLRDAYLRWAPEPSRRQPARP